MLKVIIFYFFVWWFTKLTDKKPLIVRAVLASCFSVFFLSGAITEFVSHIELSTIFGIIFLVFAILFGLRVIFDIKKILAIKNK